jgi:hypothetical protein
VGTFPFSKCSKQPTHRRSFPCSANLPPIVVRIPIYSGRVFRREAGHRSDLKPATIPKMKPAAIPINFRPGF